MNVFGSTLHTLSISRGTYDIVTIIAMLNASGALFEIVYSGENAFRIYNQFMILLWHNLFIPWIKWFIYRGVCGEHEWDQGTMETSKTKRYHSNDHQWIQGKHILHRSFRFLFQTTQMDTGSIEKTKEYRILQESWIQICPCIHWWIFKIPDDSETEKQECYRSHSCDEGYHSDIWWIIKA